MTFSEGYLTLRETRIWELRRQNMSQSDIGRELGISRQAVHKAFHIIDQKVEQAFSEAAETNNLKVKKVNLVDGVMDAHSPAHDLPVLVSLSRSNGLKIWYLYEGNCESCHLQSSCLSKLAFEAKEREIKLNSIEKLMPNQVVREIFDRYRD